VFGGGCFVYIVFFFFGTGSGGTVRLTKTTTTTTKTSTTMTTKSGARFILIARTRELPARRPFVLPDGAATDSAL